jgi:clan AA aspartic protease (TIGR02281 family)
MDIKVKVCFVSKLFALAGVALLSCSMPVQAQEPNPQLDEATSFFQQLANNSGNPFIANIAKESAARLQGNARSVTRRVIVPLLEQPDMSLAVPILIDNKVMATFLVDTGATQTVISPRMARKLGIVVTDETPRISMMTANGQVKVPLVTLHNVSIGNVTVPEVRAVIQDLGNDVLLSGLLGMNYFQGMNMSITQDSLILNVPVLKSASAL